MRRGAGAVAALFAATVPAAGTAQAATRPTISWQVTTLQAGSRVRATTLAATTSTGRKTWSAVGTCQMQRGTLIVGASGTCRVTFTVAARRPYSARRSTRTLPITTTDTATGGSTGAAGCPEGYRFPDLSAAPGAGTGYAAAKVTASCADGTLTVTANGMIAYPFTPITPNPLTAQNYTWTVTLSPQTAAATTSIRNKLGTLGFTVTGIPLYGPTEGPVPPDQAFGDPVYNNILDSCDGHTGYGGAYHYHAVIATGSCYLAETIVGYALDGYPIYSNPGWTYRSGYTRTGNPKSNSWDAYTYTGGSETLDACNGRTGTDGTYRYYLTETFPYIIGCYHGTPAAQIGAAAAPMPMPTTTSAGGAVAQAAGGARLLCQIGRAHS